MHPVLFKIGSVSIHTYGFFVALGFMSGIFVAAKEAERLNFSKEIITDLAFYILIAAILGARIFYVFTTPQLFIEDPLEIFKIWHGGLVFYGGFIAALITGIIYLKSKQVPLWKTTDIIAPSIALGQFSGRLGCFSAGCCYGKETNLSWGVCFTNTDSLAPLGIFLHPVQLYSAFANLIIFTLLWYFRLRKGFDGQLFWGYVLLYGITRAFIEILRGDFRGSVFFNIFSVSQVVGIVMSVGAIFMLLYLSRKNNACN